MWVALEPPYTLGFWSLPPSEWHGPTVINMETGESHRYTEGGVLIEPEASAAVGDQ